MRLALSVVVVVLLTACPGPQDRVDAGNDGGGGPACPEFVLSPPLIDFGCGARGEVMTLPFPDAGATPGAFASTAFTLDDAGLHFSPPEALDYTATIPLYRGECLLGTQRVIGTGVSGVLSWAPTLVDFGYVRPGLSKRAGITFNSCSTVPLALSDAATREGTSPSLVFGLDAGSLSIPGATRSDAGVLVNGTLTLEVSFSPTVVGPRQGQLVLASPLASQPGLSVTLRGVGGGPEVEVTPASLDFGVVSMASTRVVTVSNIGTPGQPPDPRANLFLGIDGGQPYFELTPGTCGAVTMASYNPTNGLSTGDSVTLSVTLQPAPAPRMCTLHVYSTDLLTPDVAVVITAQ